MCGGRTEFLTGPSLPATVTTAIQYCLLECSNDMMTTLAFSTSNSLSDIVTKILWIKLSYCSLYHFTNRSFLNKESNFYILVDNKKPLIVKQDHISVFQLMLTCDTLIYLYEWSRVYNLMTASTIVPLAVVVQETVVTGSAKSIVFKFPTDEECFTCTHNNSGNENTLQ